MTIVVCLEDRNMLTVPMLSIFKLNGWVPGYGSNELRGKKTFPPFIQNYRNNSKSLFLLSFNPFYRCTLPQGLLRWKTGHWKVVGGMKLIFGLWLSFLRLLPAKAPGPRPPPVVTAGILPPLHPCVYSWQHPSINEPFTEAAVRGFSEARASAQECNRAASSWVWRLVPSWSHCLMSFHTSAHSLQCTERPR